MVQIVVLEQLLEQQRLVYPSIAKVNAMFRKEMEILLSVPGIGPDTAAIILAEIISVDYFPTPQKLAKWVGLAPRVSQSGHKNTLLAQFIKVETNTCGVH